MALNYYWLLSVAKVSYCRMRVKCPCRCTASSNLTSPTQQDSFYAARLPILVCFFLRLTVFTKDSIKEDECGSYGAAVFVYAFVCLCTWHSGFKKLMWERQKWLVVYKVVKAYTFRVTHGQVQRLCLEMLYVVNLSLNLIVQNRLTEGVFLAHFFFLIIWKWRHWDPIWNTITRF